MRWSIRARLTRWYGTVMVVVLATFTLAMSIAARRFDLLRIDGEVVRLSTTIEGVMRMEYGERRALHPAAVETSIEAVVRDHAVRLERPNGEMLAEWGLPLSRTDWDGLSAAARDRVGPFDTRAGGFRTLRRDVRSLPEPYVLIIAAPLQTFRDRQRDIATALWVATFSALAISVVGGWLVARQALEPLTDMARQAADASTRPNSTRLTTPYPHDELGRLATSFNALLDRIGHAVGLQREFMAEASHELRTPVSVIKTAADVALSRPHRDETEYRESLTIVSAQASRLGRFVDDMFFLSRSDAGGLHMRHDAVDLEEVVASAVSSIRVTGPDRHLSFRIVRAEPIGVVGDEEQLHRMIENLLSNAMRHATPGTEVTVELTRVGGAATLVVTNQGVPIPAAHRDRIFDRFVSLTPEKDGAGLGLAIARRIAEAHGGQLCLRSSDTTGTAFEITLPL